MTTVPPHLELCAAYIALWRRRDAAARFMAALRDPDPLGALTALLPMLPSNLLTIGATMASTLTNPGCELWCLGEVIYQLTLPDHDNDLPWVCRDDDVWHRRPIGSIPADMRRESRPPFGEVYTDEEDDVSYGVVGDTFKAADFDIHEAFTISAILHDAAANGTQSALRYALAHRNDAGHLFGGGVRVADRLRRAVEGL